MRSGITRRWLRGSLFLTVLLVLLVESMFVYNFGRSYYNSVQQTMMRRFSSINGQLKMYTGDTVQSTASIRSMALRRMVEQFADKLHTRDYYSKSTYYRLFIPDLFPGLDKALYLDSDVVLLGDVSELYDVDLEDNLVGAIPDSVVGSIPALALYTKKRLRVAADHYFNAGVLLMNLDAMRECDFLNVFLRLLQSVTFQIAQDQDYLNVICKNRVEYVGFEWNTMPCDVHTNAPKLIHYNLDFKPWHRDDVAFGDVFWDYAERSGYLEEIRKVREGYTEWHIARSAEETTHLIAMGKKQARKRTANMLIRWKIRRVVNV